MQAGEGDDDSILFLGTISNRLDLARNDRSAHVFQEYFFR